MSGREPEVSIEDISDRSVVEFFKLLGFSKYELNKTDSVKNAFDMIQKVFFSVPNPVSEDPIRNVPVVGELLYRHSEKGKETYRKQKRKRERERFKNL